MTKQKTKCEKCGRDVIHDSDAYVCSYECTFCVQCAREMNFICPNCMGKLEKKADKKS